MAGLLAIGLAASASGALAQSAVAGAAAASEADGSTEISDALSEQVKQLAMASASSPEFALPGAPRIEIEVGKLDPRMKLAPCQRIEPHLPPGTRLWGKTRIGLTCAQGPTRWNVYLPLTVKVFAKGLVASSSLTAATPLSASDFTEAEVDVAAQPGALVTDTRMIVGRNLYGPLAAGQPLRQTQLKPRKFFAAGDTVRILASGPGFSASVEGQAITNGVEGLPAKVKMENGKILVGSPSADNRMDVKL